MIDYHTCLIALKVKASKLVFVSRGFKVQILKERCEIRAK